MQDLDPQLRENIDKILVNSRERLAAGDASGAIEDTETAWNMLPDPKFDWDVSKSFTHAVAKRYRDAGLFQKALHLMNDLFDSGTVKSYQDGPRFVLATIYFEMNDLDNAEKYFSEANQISKGRCFRGEDEKYHRFHKSRAKKKHH
jgi:tetratricopeptide (TPR) repeat protein